MSFIENRTLDQQTDILASYLPNGRLFDAKNKEGSNLRKILLGLAQEWLNFRGKINEVYDEYNPANTTALIEEWEGFVGIPDDCLSNTGSLEERRKNILLKLAGINATTAQQFENVAAILGFDVTVRAGVDVVGFPYTFPIVLLDDDAAPFTIIVDLDESLKPSGFPLTFPIELSSAFPEILQCFFNKLKPANTIVVFRYV